jgi:GT2 family glycosyltransferase
MNVGAGPSDRAMQFDRYQRLKAVADILGTLGASQGPVLDVGGNPGELATFLSPRRVVVLDRSAGPGMVAGDAVALPFRSDAFPATVSVDTMEHLPTGSRRVAVQEMARVSRDLVIVGCPTDVDGTRAAEAIVADFHRFLHGVEHPWLREHRSCGLPRSEEIERYFGQAGLRFEIVPNGYLRNWLAMMLLNRWLETLPSARTLLENVNRAYNTLFYGSDWRFPSYRRFYVGSKTSRGLSDLRRLGSTAPTTAGWNGLARSLGMEPAAGDSVISVAVVTRRGGALLRQCLRSLEESSLPPVDVHVVENAPPCVGSIASSLPLRVIKVGAPLSFAAANNKALRGAAGMVFLLLNDDAYLHPSCLSEIARVMEMDKRVGVVGCKIYYPNSNVLQHAGGRILQNGRTEHLGYGEVDHGQHDVCREVDYVTGAALAVRRTVLEGLGLLDEGYYPLYFEETDLCYRARERGYRVLYVPSAVAYHYELSAKGGLGVSFFVPYHRNRLRFVLKNFDRRRLLRFLAAEVPWLWTRDYGPEKVGLRRAYLSLPGMLPGWLKARARLKLPSYRRAARKGQ